MFGKKFGYGGLLKFLDVEFSHEPFISVSSYLPPKTNPKSFGRKLTRNI